jgi:hypothetical protein
VFLFQLTLSNGFKDPIFLETFEKRYNKSLCWRWHCPKNGDIVWVGISSPVDVLKNEARNKMETFDISVFFVTSFKFCSFQTVIHTRDS